jgi:mono/diheme cytochrome c family protein
MPPKVAGCFLLCAALLTVPVRSGGSGRVQILHAARESASDLEVTGLVAGLADGVPAYIRRGDLLALPQTRAITSDGPYSRGSLKISGVTFNTLARAIGALPSSDLITATCADRYRSHFPSGYIAQHQPILVLTINGQSIATWSAQAHRYDASPYTVIYAHFVPAFKILAHEDEAQLPDNLQTLNFTTQAKTFAPISPRGSFPEGSPEQQGFAIAKQNCLRCHFSGASGGTKSGRSWQSLGEWAREQPLFFEQYVKNPQMFESHSHMAANPQYDTRTLTALAAYFRTFAEAR